jgi:hypothetical protein
MDKLPNFELIGEHAVFRPSGEVALHEAAELITSAITLAYDQRIRKLLVVLTGLTGFQSPSVAERFFFVQEWARAARGFVRTAIVIDAQYIDREKFGVTVARNSGFIANIFPSEEEAALWLNGS